MKHLLSFTLLLFVFGCTSHHPDVYTYDNQAYTTTAVSDFEVDHFKAYATTNFVALEDSSDKEKNDQRNKEIDKLCRSYGLECQKIDVASKKNNFHQEVVRVHESFKDEKYFVFSLDKKSTALFAGTLSVVVDGGNQETLQGIFKQIGLEKTEAIEKKLLSLKKSK